MARVSITGLIPEGLASELNDLINWFLAKHSLEVKINLKISLSHPSADPQKDNGLILHKGNNEFEIWLSKCLSHKQMLVEIGHELTHCAQIMSGRLVKKEEFLWFDGKKITEHYLYQPHEIEARKFSVLYFNEWSKHFSA